MSESNGQVARVLDWDRMLEISKVAADREVELEKEMVCMVGLIAWGGVRKIVEDRIKEPAVADTFIVDTIEWRPSFMVPAEQVMVMPKESTELTVPFVLSPGFDGGL